MGEILHQHFSKERNTRTALWVVDAVYHIDPCYSALRLVELKDFSPRRMTVAFDASRLECAIEAGDRAEFTFVTNARDGYVMHKDMGEGIGCVPIAVALKLWKPNVVYMTGWVKIHQPQPQTSFTPR